MSNEHPHASPHTAALPEEALEKYSSAVTLSDMEIFVFPELLYSLVLANILSPRLWAWRDDPWFKDIEKKAPYRRVLRLKQYIIDHYEFNLDLETWGLTRQDVELRRFAPWMDERTVQASNALFGYEGDKYYFDLDIRRHFGLDKYTSDVIPYWKTETLEAMDAFRFRPGYKTGAGECVSLSTLYAAALFVVCRIPLEDVFLLATPLHSQNFILIKDGLLTNNRRIVTKKMWFNGTELTGRAQRALRNEHVTIVSHCTGHIHEVYPEATIAPEAYERFSEALRHFLKTSVNFEILANFLRENSDLQKCFQFCQNLHGHVRFIPAETVYAYEHAGPYKVDPRTKDKLLDTIDEYLFFSDPIQNRVCLENFESFFWEYKVDLDDSSSLERLEAAMTCPVDRKHEIIERLRAFCHIEPRLPDDGKRFVPSRPLQLDPAMMRQDIRAHLEQLRATGHPVADLAFYAHRDMAATDWRPFLKAALERNPVCIEAAKELTDEQAAEFLAGLPNESIYDGPRLAQPDEVWNFGRGDGWERALCLADILRSRHPEMPIHIEAKGTTLRFEAGPIALAWETAKGLDRALQLP